MKAGGVRDLVESLNCKEGVQKLGNSLDCSLIAVLIAVLIGVV